ncbi:MAG: hypothetical protein K5770_02895 [Lachnospiraceae bacterium]|nr:hypothetical protein [Lachnospiraceae bacterium]
MDNKKTRTGFCNLIGKLSLLFFLCLITITGKTSDIKADTINIEGEIFNTGEAERTLDLSPTIKAYCYKNAGVMVINGTGDIPDQYFPPFYSLFYSPYRGGGF